MNRMVLLTIEIAEETMKRLSTDEKVQSNVEWLTEVVRRLSESAMDSSMNSVKMSPMRLEKVHLTAFSRCSKLISEIVEEARDTIYG